MSLGKNILDCPPFPRLRWEDCDWWDGSFEAGPFGGVGLTVTPYDPEVTRLSEDFQREAFSYLNSHWDEISAAVLRALVPWYEMIRPRYLDFLGADAESLMPEIKGGDELLDLIDLRQVHIPPWSKDGIGYAGLQYGCSWDVEHGLGAILHLDRVVKQGGADVSFAWEPEEADRPD